MSIRPDSNQKYPKYILKADLNLSGAFKNRVSLLSVTFRSSHPEMFHKIIVVKKFARHRIHSKICREIPVPELFLVTSDY